MGIGPALFGIVEEYSALGVHRTGTPVDWATTEWMADHLTRRGLEARVETYGFEQWTSRSSLIVDGSPIDHLPVYYEFVGEVATNSPRIASIDPMSGGFPGVLDAPTADARAAGAEAVVIATEHPNGSLVAVNRVPGDGSGVASVLAAGRDLDLLQTADSVELELHAQLSAGRTATVMATNGRPGPPLVVSTPLTGWFTCAGERATGIAVLLDLVTRLADVPLLVVATTGHEIGHLGVERWVNDAHPLRALGIVHLGASIGVEDEVDGRRRLASTRVAMTNLDGDRSASMVEALRPAALELSVGTESWIGEAQTFSALKVPMLSLSGAGIDFHTPQDLPRRATSAEAMAIAADAVAAAVTDFVTVTQEA